MKKLILKSVSAGALQTTQKAPEKALAGTTVTVDSTQHEALKGKPRPHVVHNTGK